MPEKADKETDKWFGVWGLGFGVWGLGFGVLRKGGSEEDGASGRMTVLLALRAVVTQRYPPWCWR
ncbi:hypothetical protein DMH17_00990 [Raoultella planticola]|nr:hypothetical protein [Raoultella planticola]